MVASNPIHGTGSIIMRKLLSVFLLVVAATACARAESAPHWVEVRSEHFTVLTDSSEKQGRHIAGQFERMRDMFRQLLPNAPSDAGSPIVVLALKDRKGFQSLEPTDYLAKGQLDLAGYFITNPEKSYILVRLDAQGEHPFAVVYHEYTHFELRKAEWMPLWMNEGLAEFYQNTDIEDKDVRLGQPSEYDIRYLRENKLLPLTTLIQVDHSSPYYHEEQKGSAFYAESWALTHYIEITDKTKGTHRLQDYAKYLIQGEDSVAAAQHAFGDLNQLEKALNSYIQQGSFSLFVMKASFTVDESSFKSDPISLDDANVIRAGVLVANNRFVEAQALLDSVLHDDPNNTMAHESMGFLCLQQHDDSGARKWFGEAVKLNSQNYLVYYYYAVLSLRSRETGMDDSIESSLRTAIKLGPSFAPSYDALAHFYTIHNTKLDEAYILCLQAIQRDPQELNYRYTSAQVRIQQQQYASAVSIFQNALKIVHDPRQIDILKARIADMERFEAQVESQKGAQAAPGQPSEQISTSTDSVTVESNGNRLVVRPREADYPDVPPTGARRSAQGVLRNVHCFAPKGITLAVEQRGKSVSLYSNDLYKINLTTIGYVTSDEINACTSFEGRNATVKYAEVNGDQRVAGQIVAIELSK